jgi:hypothetical protein
MSPCGERSASLKCKLKPILKHRRRIVDGALSATLLRSRANIKAERHRINNPRIALKKQLNLTTPRWAAFNGDNCTCVSAHRFIAHRFISCYVILSLRN